MLASSLRKVTTATFSQITRRPADLQLLHKQKYHQLWLNRTSLAVSQLLHPTRALVSDVTSMNHSAGPVLCMCEIICPERDFHKLWPKIQSDLSVEDKPQACPEYGGRLGGGGLWGRGEWCRVTAPSGIFLLGAAWCLSPTLSPD